MDAVFTAFGIVPDFLVVCNFGIIFATSKFDVNLIFLPFLDFLNQFLTFLTYTLKVTKAEQGCPPVMECFH